MTLHAPSLRFANHQVELCRLTAKAMALNLVDSQTAAETHRAQICLRLANARYLSAIGKRAFEIRALQSL
jgi:hypothetical protein